MSLEQETEITPEIKGLAIVVDNVVETNADKFNGPQVERREEVQDLNFFLKDKLGFLVLCFNGLSSKALKDLLKIVQDIATEFRANFNAFALIILSKGGAPEIYGSNNEPIPIGDILSYFSDENCPQFMNKLKLFFFQTILNEDGPVPQRRISIPSNSVVLSVYPTNESQVPVFVDRVKARCRTTPIDEIVDTIKEQLRDHNCRVECRKNFDRHCNRILATRPTHNNDNNEDLDQQYQLSLVIWCPIRRQTIEFLDNQKDEILKIVRDVRIAKIAGSATSLIVGGALTITGLILIPFTFGASIGLTLAGAGVGALGTATSFGAAIVSKVMTSTRLKEAHDHIKLDQQLSSNVNDIANEYNRALQSAQSQGKAKMNKADIAHGALGIGARVSVGAAKGSAAGIEIGLASGGAIARAGTVGLRAAAIAGGVVGGVALVVTAPLDIYQIASNSYHLVKSGKNGENEKDLSYKWYMDKIRKMERELYRIQHTEPEEDNDESDDETKHLMVQSTRT